MEKNEIVLKRDELREQLEEKDKDLKVGKIAYYEDFEVIKGDKNHNSFSEKDVFVVTRKMEADGKEFEYYELYDGNKQLIARTDENGELQYSEEFKEKLGPMYSYLQLGKRDMYLNRENEFLVEDKPIEEMTLEEKVESKKKEDVYREHKVDYEEPALIEDDLGMERNSISYCDSIKDKRFFEMVPESKDFSQTAMLIYSQKTEEFMIVGVKDGKFEKYSSIDSAKSTMKNTQDLGREGENVSKNSIGGIMNFKGKRDFDFSVNIDGMGNVKLQELRRDQETGKIISSDLETGTQYRASWKVEEMMNEKEKQDISDDVERIEEKEEEKIVNIDEIREEEEEDEKVPWENLQGYRTTRKR